MTKHFYVTNSQGVVIRSGSCSEDTFEIQAAPGETVHDGQAPEQPIGLWFDGSNYKNQRLNAYPAIPDQMDAVFKMAEALSQSGIQLPADTVAWIEQCRAVKNTYPKA